MTEELAIRILAREYMRNFRYSKKRALDAAKNSPTSIAAILKAVRMSTEDYSRFYSPPPSSIAGRVLNCS